MSDLAEFQSKLSELIEDHWDLLSPLSMFDPLEDDEDGYIDMAERSVATTWLLIGEAAPIQQESGDASFLFTVRAPMTSPIHAQGLALEFMRL